MKIFNLHLSKCGHTSLRMALNILGLKGYQHLIKNKIISDLVLNGELDRFPRFDFLSDFGMALPEDLVPILDEFYPNSKYILTIRDKETRLESVRKHIEQEPNSPPYNRTTRSEHHDKCIEFYNEYFKNKDNLLILPIEAKNKWELLCNFLGKPIPDIPYPIENVAPKGQK